MIPFLCEEGGALKPGQFLDGCFCFPSAVSVLRWIVILSKTYPLFALVSWIASLMPFYEFCNSPLLHHQFPFAALVLNMPGVFRKGNTAASLDCTPTFDNTAARRG